MTRRPIPSQQEAPGPAAERRALDPDGLLRAMTRLLRPMVRLLIRAGVTFPALSDLLRTLYVEVAQSELADPVARTDSRISLLTGVHRKEIRRLRLLPVSDDPPPAAALGQQRIIARWLGTPAFGDAQGRPLPLPRNAEQGASFDALIRSVTTDVRPRAVLENWLDQGLVRIDDEGRVRLQVGAFLPSQESDALLFFFARNLHDHIAAAGANVLSVGTAPFLDRSVHYDRLSAASVARLVAAGREAAQALLLDINRLALAELEAAPAGDAPSQRVNLGIYLYTEDDKAAS